MASPWLSMNIAMLSNMPEDDDDDDDDDDTRQVWKWNRNK
jgi:hypothetical protein